MSTPEARIADNTPAQDGWRLLRVHSSPSHPLEPGQWLELAAGDKAAAVAVYRFHAGEGWWAGLLSPEHRLAELRPGDTVSVAGLHGQPLPRPDSATVMLGVGEGVGPVLARAEEADQPPELVLMGDTSGLPVRLCPSRFVVNDLPGEVMAGVAPLEAAGVVARVAIPGNRPGCYDGDAFELLRHYLASRQIAGHAPPRRLIAAAPWRLLAPWHSALAQRFDAVHCLELPASDAHPR